MQIFGFAMTSPAVVLDYLEGNGKNVYICDNDKKIPAVDFVLSLSFYDFKHYRKVLGNSKAIILFAPALALRQIEGVVMLDVKLASKPDLDRPLTYRKPKLSRLLIKKKGPASIIITEQLYTTDLVETALSGSILTHLMTFLYKISNTKQQNDYRDSIIEWFVFGDGKLATIKRIVDSLKQKELRLGLFTLIKENIHYHTVFQRLKQEPDLDLTNLNVNEFDINYMLSVANKANKKLTKA